MWPLFKKTEQDCYPDQFSAGGESTKTPLAYHEFQPFVINVGPTLVSHLFILFPNTFALLAFTQSIYNLFH